jgi:hypothetical protein
MSDEVFRKYMKLFAVIASLLVIGFLLYTFFLSGPKVVNPAKNNLDVNPEAGKSYALLYNQGELYQNIKNNEDNLRRIQEDLAIFARTTRPEFANQEVLLGFTFEDGFTRSDNTFKHFGHFYGLGDRIELSVTVLERGIITLSLTNTEDGTNIDDSLQLNGEVNELLTKLPITDDFYSIRYFNSQDEIVVGFFLGYSLEDVEEVEKILAENLENEYKTANIVYSITSRGIFTLEEVKEFANSPENTF